MSLSNWINYLSELDNGRCIACGESLDNGFRLEWHEANCIDRAIGYNLYNEKTTPETRMYFLKAKNGKLQNK